MAIFSPFAAEKTKPNKPKTNPILAQNWVRFSNIGFVKMAGLTKILLKDTGAV